MTRRTERIGKLMQHAISTILLREISDPRIDMTLTSITRVEVQEDLLAGKVYVSVMGSEADQNRTVAALNHAAGRIQGLLRKDVSIRHMPTLTFFTDEKFKGAWKTWEVIRQAMAELKEKESKEEGTGSGEQAPEKTEEATGDSEEGTGNSQQATEKTEQETTGKKNGQGNRGS